jgi:hypothetical protein
MVVVFKHFSDLLDHLKAVESDRLVVVSERRELCALVSHKDKILMDSELLPVLAKNYAEPPVLVLDSKACSLRWIWQRYGRHLGKIDIAIFLDGNPDQLPKQILATLSETLS